MMAVLWSLQGDAQSVDHTDTARYRDYDVSMNVIVMERHILVGTQGHQQQSGGNYLKIGILPLIVLPPDKRAK